MRSLFWTSLCRAAPIALAALLLAPSAGRADTYLVDSSDDLPDANTADNSCATAAPAACTLRAAVMQANAHFGADIIEVPAGTYVLAQELAIAPVDHKELTINGVGDLVIIDANGADRAFEVIDGPLTLSHVTIRNGNAASYGGAIYAHGGTSLSLSDCALLDNSAALGGGAIHATDMDVTISNGIVQGNAAQGDGGGIAVVGESKDPTLVLVGLEIAGNQAQGNLARGGGVSMYRGSVQVSACFLHDNASGYSGGGLDFLAFSPDLLQINDSVFDHNAGGASGAGGALSALGPNTIERTRFSNNSAGSGGAITGQGGPHVWTDVAISGNQASSGGGVEIGGGDISIVRGRISGNTATYEGGGFDMINGTILFTLTDSTVFGNSAPNGGGVWTTGPLKSMSSAIYGNHATTAGGGIYAGQVAAFSEAATVELTDTILDHNGAGANGGGLYVDSMAQARLYSSTITGNGARQNYPSPGSGGGVYVVSPAVVTAFASVFAYNINSSLTAAPSDCSGTLTAAGYDFVGTSSGCTIVGGGTGNQIGGATGATRIDPQLSAFVPLYDPALPASPKASPKPGRVPLSGSPLINAGPPKNFPDLGCTDADGNPLFWDEIGELRTLGGRCDIGAVEFGAALDEVFADGFEG